MPTVHAFWPWFMVAAGLLLAIVFTLRHLSKTMDFSRTFGKRWQSRADRGDDGGLFTTIDDTEHAELDQENRKLKRAPLPETALRADLPNGTTDEVVDEIDAMSTRTGLRTQPGQEIPADSKRRIDGAE